MRVVTFALLGLLSSVARPQELPVRIASDEVAGEVGNVVRPDAIRAHVEFLADDLLEGRGTGSRGHAIAAAYVAAQFKQSGLAPFGENSTYLQTVHLLEATPVLPGSAAKFQRDEETVNFEYGADYLPGADYGGPTSTLTAPLAFAGFGITAPELNYDDLAQVDVHDRVAVIFSGAPARLQADQRAYYSWSGEKYANLIRHGAIGIITVDTPEDSARTPWEKRVAMSWQPQMRWLDSNGRPADAFPELKQRFRFKPDTAAKFFQTATRNWEQALTAAGNGEAQGFSLPGTVTLTATTGLRHTESVNVLGVLRGSDPKLKNEFIVVTAHLDHLGRGAAVNGDSIYNGAHDNASGVAIMLEMARALAIAPRPRRSILFAAVTAEEKGLLGSDFFVNQPSLHKVTLVANLNLDMPLVLAPTRDVIALGAEHSTLGPMAMRAAQTLGYTLSPDNAPEEVHFIRSDQFSFVRHGIPALHIISGYRSRLKGIDAQALQREFLQNHYHQPSDDLSLPFDYAAAADLARINAAIALEIANDDARPSFYRRDFFGRKFAKYKAAGKSAVHDE